MRKLSERLLKVEEIALSVGVSVYTINIWYKWKRSNPDNDLSKLLPDYIQEGARQTRYWKQSDVWKLLEFRKHITRGRNGVLGSITQKYTKKRRTN